MNEALKTAGSEILSAFVGGILGYILSKLLERWKASRAYRLVKIEIDRNLIILQRLKDAVFAEPTAEPEQLARIFNLLPSSLKNLDKQQIPLWSYVAWESQMGLLALKLSDEQIKKIYDLQVFLQTASFLHSKIQDLILIHRDKAKEPAMKILSEWQIAAENALKIGNPL